MAGQTPTNSVDDVYSESQVLVSFICGIVATLLLGCLGALLVVLPRMQQRNALPADELERRAINYLQLNAAADGHVSMDIELDPLAAEIQYAVQLGIFSPQHVAYQNVWRLLLRAQGKEDTVPRETFDALRSIDETHFILCGKRCAHLRHGAGAAGSDQLASSQSPKEFIESHNGGHFHPRTIQRGLPAAFTEEGMQVIDLLNFMEGCRAIKLGVSYTTKSGKFVTVAFNAFDGMMIKKGFDVDSAAGRVIGAKGGSLSYDTLITLLGKTDEEIRAFVKENQLVSEVVEVMLASGDNRVKSRASSNSPRSSSA